MALTDRQRYDRDEIARHWPPYLIGAYVSPDGHELWTATAGDETVSAMSAAALRLRIRAHYDAHPELRHRPPESGDGTPPAA